MNSNHQVRLVFFGSPLVDITANVDDIFLKRFGLEPDTAYTMDQNNLGIFEEIRTKSSVKVGGSVTNTARMVHKLRDSPLITYFGSIGNDDYGRLIKSQLVKEGLGSDLTEVDGNTGKVAVLIKEKTRTLVTDLGASRFFSLNEKMWSKMAEPCLIYISGFFINVSCETISELISNQKTIAFNLGAPFLCSKFPQQMKDLYRNSSVIFGNEKEHLAFAQINNINSKNSVDGIMAINRLYSNKQRIVVVTRGPDSVLVVQNEESHEYPIRPIDEEKIIDSNGAGDAFAGGFLARYVDGASVASCVNCGIEMAREIIQREGFTIDF